MRNPAGVRTLRWSQAGGRRKAEQARRQPGRRPTCLPAGQRAVLRVGSACGLSAPAGPKVRVRASTDQDARRARAITVTCSAECSAASEEHCRPWNTDSDSAMSERTDLRISSGSAAPYRGQELPRSWSCTMPCTAQANARCKDLVTARDSMERTGGARLDIALRALSVEPHVLEQRRPQDMLRARRRPPASVQPSLPQQSSSIHAGLCLP